MISRLGGRTQRIATRQAPAGEALARWQAWGAGEVASVGGPYGGPPPPVALAHVTFRNRARLPAELFPRLLEVGAAQVSLPGGARRRVEGA